MFVCDFHIHSKYSRATSKDMDIPNLAKWAKIKGIDLLGTGDFTHPQWLGELKKNLESVEYGIYRHGDTSFILTAEVSNIYFKAGKSRRIHNVLFAPSFEVAGEVNKALSQYGDLYSDGRPMLRLEADKLVKKIMAIDKNCIIIPGHIWTPHFGLFGANSGFDSIEECFEEQTEHIYALETGLSSDPLMNWRWSALDRFTLVSNSDAHCVHPDTNIYAVNGKPIAIKNLNLSKVLSIDFAGDLRQKEGKVSKLHKLLSPPILYKVATRTKEVITTPEHRFFILENEEIIEKKACELEKGDLVACLRQISHNGESKRLSSFDIDHELEILPEGINCLRTLRIKGKRTQNDVGKYIGVKEGCIWIFEKNKVKTPKESFIDRYCECVGVDKDTFKKKFLINKFPVEKFPEYTNVEFCQILGYVLGDGGIERSRERVIYLSLTDKNVHLLNYYQKLIRKIFNIDGKLKKYKGNSNGVRYSAYLAEYFQKVAKMVLAPSPRRQVPDFIFCLPKKEIAAFLGGFFDAEGTVGHHFVQFSSSSLILIKQIQILLLKFGLQSYVYSNFEKNKKKWRYILGIYSQEQLKRFTNNIKFRCNIKREKLLKYISSLSESSKNSFTDFLPVKSEILRVKKELAVSCYDIPSRLYYHLAHDNTLKRGNVKEFIDIFSNYLTESQLQKNSIVEKLNKFAESDLIWEGIQETKTIKSDCRYVYDLTVPNHENYVANGFITHNSPKKIGREANIFSSKPSYKDILEALKNKDKTKFLYTVEFFPQEGKYHWDGHRKCNIRLSPSETSKVNNTCPACGRKLTIGVMHRVTDLGDREEGFVLNTAPGYKHMVPLTEIIANVLKVGPDTVGVEREYNKLINTFGNEFNILLDVREDELKKRCSPKIASGIIRVRQGNVNVLPGYDGVYGEVKVFDGEEEIAGEKQLSFF